MSEVTMWKARSYLMPSGGYLDVWRQSDGRERLVYRINGQVNAWLSGDRPPHGTWCAPNNPAGVQYVARPWHPSTIRRHLREWLREELQDSTVSIRSWPEDWEATYREMGLL